MEKSTSKILLHEILDLGDLDNVKIRFNLMFKNNWNPIEIFKNGDIDTLLEGHYSNFKYKSFKQGQITVGFIRLNRDDFWLLFHVGRVTKDLNKLDSVDYEYEILTEFEKYFGRLIIRFKNKSQNMIRLAKSVIEDCEVVQILPDVFDNDIFPVYDQVNISSDDLSRKHDKQYQKGHTVTILHQDETKTTDEFKPEKQDNVIILDPDVKKYFPNSESVNSTLRSLIKLIPTD